MKEFGEIIKTIYRKNIGLFVAMIFLVLISVALLIFSLMNLHPNLPVANIGYSDLTGYRSGSWTSFLAFPVLAIVFGMLHNLIAVRLYEKRGGGFAIALVGLSILLVVATFLVLIRLLGES